MVSVSVVFSGPGDLLVPVMDRKILAVAGVPVSHQVELAAAVVAAAAPVALALPVHVLAAAVRTHRVALVRSAKRKRNYWKMMINKDGCRMFA